jgi:hypothetical protein
LREFRKRWFILPIHRGARRLPDGPPWKVFAADFVLYGPWESRQFPAFDPASRPELERADLPPGAELDAVRREKR